MAGLTAGAGSAPVQQRNNGLQAVRGAAALFVLFQHVTWIGTYFSPGPTDILYGLRMGSLGVFLFFALSGYLMASQMTRPPVRFLTDRVRRIYPGYIIAILVAGAALTVFDYPAWPKLTTVFLLPTGASDSVLIPYWTLVYEMQFYFLILLIGRFKPSVSIGLLLAWALAIAIWHPVSPETVERATYPFYYEIGLSFYNLYFIVGALSWFASKAFIASTYELWVGCALLLFASLLNLVTPGMTHDYYLIMLPAVLLVIRGATAWRASDLISRGLVRFGDVSYGVYLIHISACFCAMLLLKKFYIELTYWQGCAYVLVVGGTSAFVFGMIELRLQEALKQWTTRDRVRAQLSPAR